MFKGLLILISIGFITLIFGKQMTDQKISWTTQVLRNSERDGTIFASGRDGFPVVLQWHVRTMSDSDFYEKQKEMAETSVDAFTKVEMDFLCAYPNEALQDEHFKTLKSFFADGADNVDWAAATEKMRERIRAIYEMKAVMPADTIFVFVFLKNPETNEQLGSAQFFILPTYPDGDVRVTSIAVKPEYQRQGFGKLLMGSIFTIISETKRIFLSTRITNDGAIKAYAKWGFTKDPNPQVDHFAYPEHWIHLECKTMKY